ncbi:metal ABC transporter ATP-binding protein [Longirhabdus pacifica]|uniref:metal ABC transporter ATP-binding protein n=1 Tax=Longirhabdus pacifica TaxID=2305227 RepID=UPI001008938D|nr:metal ABC transporter ATP-binding protein [Longirhabdus pacifica]
MEQPCHQDIVNLEDVCFSYGNHQVIQHLNFTIKERDFVGVIGSNGAGKSTLLKMIVGLIQPKTGRVELFGKNSAQFKEREKIGYVPQKNALNPLFPATVKEVVLSGLYSRKKILRRIHKQDLEVAQDAMESFSIEHLADRKIGQLSGGQQQRVFLARAMINKPKLLILDEPTVGIDEDTQRKFFQLIQHMHQHHDMTFIMVSHDIEAMHSYLGSKPQLVHDQILFFVKHSHEIHCDEITLAHGITS